MNYTIEHIKAAFQAAKKGLLESDFIKYLEVHSHLHTDAPGAKRGRKPGVSATAVSQAKPGRKAKRAKRGALGESILKYLSTKGKEGAHVKDIAVAAKSKPVNVTAWFYSTGKKNKAVKPHGKNVFSYVPKD
jgi:hypothetical protein